MICALEFRRQPTAKLRGEEGQTIALVAVCLTSLVLIGALAIDLTNLYSARGEIQRAADATALAGAKAFVDSGVMTDPSLQSRALAMAQAYVKAAAPQNMVAGATPQVLGSPQISTVNPGNPTITVTLQRTNLPLFFAHVWGNNFASVSATATAEAYNPPSAQTGGGEFLPSAPKCVKPLLVSNLVSISGGAPVPIVDPKTGQVASASQLVGLPFNDVKSFCQPGAGCQVPPNQKPGARRYVPMQDPNPHNYLPACTLNSDFAKSVAGCDGVAFTARQCGGSAKVAWDPNVNNSAAAVTAGLQCLLHVSSGNPQDSIPNAAFRSGNGLLITPGIFSQARYGVATTDNILTSDSIITVPIFDQRGFSSSGGNQQVTVVGFLTLFVKTISGNPGQFSATILNVTGCGPNPSSAPPVSGGGVSSIPVRLIHN